MSEFEIGQVYQVQHSRKGTFAICVTAQDDEWVTGTIVDGRAKMISMTVGDAEEGESITLRKSFTTIIEGVYGP